MNEPLLEFYWNKKGYDMAIIIPKEIADKLQPEPQPEPQPAPQPTQQGT